MSARLQHYRISVPQTERDDLNSRLAQDRWPDRETAPDWQQGVTLEAARRLAEYWHRQYSWRRFEVLANRYPRRKRLPILLLHGWPSSFAEFLKSGRNAFDIILPSIPGCGFTEAPKAAGWDMECTSRTCIELMEDCLGYKRWIAQGGDSGAAIATLIAKSKPPGLMAIHLNLLFVIPEVQAIVAFLQTQAEQSGSKSISSTHPQTISYDVDEMLDNISVHWFSRSAGSISQLEVPVVALVERLYPKLFRFTRPQVLVEDFHATFAQLSK
ncbi:alpha/beta-hydrolase [Thozetella sp. PMI_491]|nr:alpha/beta-hydrolase [Thozetella sp. PMI_491]